MEVLELRYDMARERLRRECLGSCQVQGLVTRIGQHQANDAHELARERASKVSRFELASVATSRTRRRRRLYHGLRQQQLPVASGSTRRSYARLDHPDLEELSASHPCHGTSINRHRSVGGALERNREHHRIIPSVMEAMTPGGWRSSVASSRDESSSSCVATSS